MEAGPLDERGASGAFLLASGMFLATILKAIFSEHPAKHLTGGYSSSLRPVVCLTKAMRKQERQAGVLGNAMWPETLADRKVPHRRS